MHYTVSVCLLLYKIRFYPLKNLRPKIVVSYRKKGEKTLFQKEGKQINTTCCFRIALPSLRKCILMGLVYMKMVELREDIFQVICFFTYVYDSMYTCLFRRISRHRFRCGCVTGVMFCDKRIYIEQTLYILGNVTFWGNIFNSACLFHWCMFRANIYIHPSWRQEMHDTHFTDAFTAMKARPFCVVEVY